MELEAAEQHAGHRHGGNSASGLPEMIRLLDPKDAFTVLDVGTGCGDTAIALSSYVKEVVAIDSCQDEIAKLLNRTRKEGIANVKPAVMDAAKLDYRDSQFDAVVSRFAAHHFVDIERSVKEMVRVLKSDGYFVICDSLAPEELEARDFINRVRRLKDESVVAIYSHSQWADMLTGAGLEIDSDVIIDERGSLQDWFSKPNFDAHKKSKIQQEFLTASSLVRSCFSITYMDGQPAEYTSQLLVCKARRIR